MTNEMTAEEAIQILDDMKVKIDVPKQAITQNKRNQAIDLAIKALEQQPSEDCISREHAKQFLYYEIEHLHDDGLYDCFARIIDDMYNELPSVTPRINLAETSQDCISREEVQDLISRWLSDYLLDETREALETINYKVGDMPSVTPERPKGKWMECGGDEPWLKGYCCSLCNFTATNKYNYCPDCGAEMSGGGEDEEEA